MTEHEKELLAAYEKNSGEISIPEGWLDEGYEKPDLKGVEKALWKFQKRLNLAPQQLFRFPTYGSPPLLYSTASKHLPPKDIPPCERCGSKREFEFQMMPAFLSVLERAGLRPESEGVPFGKENLSALMEAQAFEFGTVLFYTCSKDCSFGNPSYSLEFAFAQPLS